MSIYITSITVFITVFLIIFLLLLMLRRRWDPTIKRIKELEKSPKKSIKKSKGKDTSIKKKGLEIKVEKVLADVGCLTKQDKEKISNLKQSLIQAGYHREESTKIFIGLKIVSTIAFFILFFQLGLLWNRPFVLVLILSSVVGLVGYSFPDIILNAKIQKRQGQIASILSDAIDLLVVTVEAGVGLNAALLKVGDDFAVRCPPLAEECTRVNQDIRIGMSREEALRELSNRNKIEDLGIFVGALIMADRLGTSIGDTLRAQADSLRTRIRQRVEEQAAKSGIKMLFPLVLFILPALIIIIMGPGLISVYRTFQP